MPKFLKKLQYLIRPVLASRWLLSDVSKRRSAASCFLVGYGDVRSFITVNL